MKKQLIIYGIASFIRYFLTVVASLIFSNSINLLIDNELKKSLELLMIVGIIYFLIVIVYYFENVYQEKYLVTGITNARMKLLNSKKDYELSTLISDIDILEKNYFSSNVALINSLLATTVNLVGIFVLNYWIAFLIIFISITTYYITKFIEKYQEKAITDFTKESELFTNKVNDLFLGRNDFKSNHLLQHFAKVNNNVFNVFKNSRMRFSKMIILANSSFIFVSNINQLLTYLACILLIGFGYMKIGVIVALMVLVGYIFNNYSQIYIHYNQSKVSKKIFDKYNDLKDEKIILSNCNSSIELKNISFNYGDTNILNNHNFVFEKNKKYAIIAESGKGKTTLLKILGGFLKPNQGEIIVDNKVVDDYQGLNNLNYINQFSHIFNDSLEFNLTLGIKHDQDKLKEIIKEFEIDKFSNDLDNNLKFNGDNISGGQKQRIILARNILLNKDIMILDESFNSLDKDSSKKLENILLDKKDLTLIVVNHHFDENQLSKYDVIYRL